MKHNELYNKLEYHYRAFDRSKISPDPLEVLHRYSEPKDIEIIGLLSSIFSYGNVKLILRAIGNLEAVIGKNPYEFVGNFNYSRDKKLFVGIRYRFYSGSDIANLFRLLHYAVSEFESLENLFINGDNEIEENVREGINNFSRWFISKCDKMKCSTNGTRFMFPVPEKGSAAKRFNLYLRWMVRKDKLDFGLWEKVDKSRLVIPVDVHIARISRKLGLTQRKNVTWKMAEEITTNLKKFDSSDPVKYDFALCHIGMRKLDF